MSNNNIKYRFLFCFILFLSFYKIEGQNSGQCQVSLIDLKGMPVLVNDFYLDSLISENSRNYQVYISKIRLLNNSFKVETILSIGDSILNDSSKNISYSLDLNRIAIKPNIFTNEMYKDQRLVFSITGTNYLNSDLEFLVFKFNEYSIIGYSIFDCNVKEGMLLFINSTLEITERDLLLLTKIIDEM